MKIRTQLLLATLALFTASVTRADNILWTNAVNGNWSAVTNWSPNQTPGAADVAVITNAGNYTVTVDVNPTISGLVLGTTGGGGTQTLVINGQTFELDGTATVSSNGQFNLADNGILKGTAVLDGALNCAGGAASGSLSGTLLVLSNSVLNIAAPGVTFNAFFAGVGVVTNYGTMNWNSGILHGDNTPQIFNYGVWNVQTDSTFSGHQTSGDTTINNFGTFRKSAGNGTNTLDGNTFFNNFGTVDMQSGTLAIQAGAGTGLFNITNGTAISLGSAFVFTGNSTFTGTGVVGNFLIGNNGVLNGALTYSGGTMSGTLTLASNAVFNIAAPLTFNSLQAGIALFTNYGTMNWSNVTLFGDSSPQIYNYGIWNAQSDNTFSGRQSGGGTTIFNNSGTFLKSAGSGTTTMDGNTLFNNSGTLDIRSGTLVLQQGSGQGTVNIAGGANFTPASSFVFTGSTTFTGTGTVGNSLVGNDAVLYGTLTCSGVTMSGTVTLASNSVLNVGSSALTFNGGSTLFTNYGTLAWNTGSLFGDNNPTIYNYGVWSVQSDNSFSGGFGGSTTTFKNFGTFRKSTATGTTTMGDFISFNNSGTVDVQSGTVAFIGSYVLTGGTLNFGINNSNDFGRVSFAGSTALSGTVSANLNNLFAPRTNNSFAVVTYGSRTGTFTNFNLPAGLVWTNNYGGSTFSLIVAAVKPAQLSAVAVQSGGNFSFSFGVVPGQTYQVQTTTNLAPANWINLGAPIFATNGTVTVSDPIGLNPLLFYRTVLQ